MCRFRPVMKNTKLVKSLWRAFCCFILIYANDCHHSFWFYCFFLHCIKCINARLTLSISSFISGLKFISMNINSKRGKKLELLAFLDFHQPHVVAIQETKIDSSVATSELFPETCPYSVYRKDRNIHGGGVMLLVHKDISHMPITELENDSESIWVKVFANKTSHFVAS